MNLLKSVNLWLQNQPEHEISYKAFKEILENSAQVSKGRVLTLCINITINMGHLVLSHWEVHECKLSTQASKREGRERTGGKRIPDRWAAAANRGEVVTKCNETDVRTSVWQYPPRSPELQGRLSVWPLHQSKTTLEDQSDAYSVNEMSECGLEMHTAQVHKNIFFISICTLLLSLCQHIQLKIYVLLSLEWSLHASSIRPHANWNSHLLTSLAFSRKINGSMNQWEGMNRHRLRGNGLRRHTHTPNRYYWHVSNPVNHASDGNTERREKRLYVRENMLLDSTEARG